MLEGHDGSAVGTGALADTHGSHGLLLSLAGLIDDELLGWCRELTAVGESDYALELVTAAVAADHVRVPEAVHAALSRTAKGQPALSLPAPDPAPVMTHRFLADPASVGHSTSGRSPVDVLHTLPTRLVRGCRLWLSWRLTPAGSAPTPVPHPVLLLETADGGGADVLAYQVADLLGQAGVFASVEVFGAGAALDEYHRAALAASVPLETDGVVGTAPAEGSGHSGPGGVLPAALAASLPQRTDPSQTSPRGNPRPHPQPSPRGGLPSREPFGRDHDEVRDPRPPLRPVDRVIAARASAPRNPIDNVKPFERGPVDRPIPDRPALDRPAAGLFEGIDSRDDRKPPADPRQPRDQRWNPGGDQRPNGAPGPNGAMHPNGAVAPGPNGVAPNGVKANGAGPNGAGPNGAGPNGAGPGPNGPMNGVERAPRNGMGPNQPPPMGLPPVRPQPMNNPPTMGAPTGRQQPVNPPQGPPPGRPPGPPPRGQVPGPPPKRPPLRPTEAPELPDGLSDVEQKLLRQLHEELAQREDNGLPAADQPPQRMFRNTNGGGRPPQRPMGPPEGN